MEKTKGLFGGPEKNSEKKNSWDLGNDEGE